MFVRKSSHFIYVLKGIEMYKRPVASTSDSDQAQCMIHAITICWVSTLTEAGRDDR